MSLLGKPIEDVIETLYRSIKSKRQIITDIKKEYNVDNNSFNDIKINRFKLILYEIGYKYHINSILSTTKMVVLATRVEICFILRGILDTFDINY